MIDTKEDGRDYRDNKGRTFTDAEFDSILPTFYYRQLMADNRLPDSLFGKTINPKILQKESFIFRTSPASQNASKLGLYQLMESKPKRVDLKMPNDVFRFSSRKGLQFIDIETNQVNREKTKVFKDLFKQKGAILPIKVIDGNPSTRKEYDEGYFFVDAEDKLFHFKQVNGKPMLRNIKTDKKIAHIYITEFSNRRFYAFLVDTDHRFYVLTRPEYEIKEVDIHPFNPDEDGLMIIGNMFDWTVKKSTNTYSEYYAISSKDYSVIDTMRKDYPPFKYDRIAEYIFPFELNFTSYLDKFMYPRFTNLSMIAIYVNIIFCLLYILITYFVRRKRREKAYRYLLYAIPILIFGIFAFIPITFRSV